MKKVLWLALPLLFCLSSWSHLGAQDRIITIPKPVLNAPFQVQDTEDLFGKAYRFFLEGEVKWAADSLRKLLSLSSFKLDEQKNYYIVVANFNDRFNPVGMLREGAAFTDTRLYGLKNESLYYIFISKRDNAESFLSAMLTAKPSPFEANLFDFLSLFLSFPASAAARADIATTPTVWIDVRKFEIPTHFQKHCDISLIVRKDLEAERNLTSAILDNTSRERWSYGIATAITTIDDVDFVVGDDGRIIVRPKPDGDLAAFGVINYHFQPVDTKAPTIASSFHLLFGARIDNSIEPVVGVGFGFPINLPVEVHFFGGASVQFANELKTEFIDEFENNLPITDDVDPFKLNVRVRPRLGLELKFP